MLNSEGHDESQFLPRNTPPVNPFRAQHGGVKWEGKAIKAIEWLPDGLFERGLLEQAHLNTACCFYRAMIATRQALGITDIKGIISQRIKELSSSEPRDIFFPIMRQLRKKDSCILLWLAEEKSTEANIVAAFRIAGDIHYALENAQLIIDYLSKPDKVSPVHAPEVSQKL